MQLVRFSVGSKPTVIGIIRNGHVHALADLVSDLPQDMRDLIADWDRVKAVIAGVDRLPVGLPLGEVTLRAPIARPGKILALGLNYADHIEEAKDAGVTIPTEQVWFCKQPTSVNAPFGGIHKPIVSDQLDYEVELVAVIGKKCRRIPAERAQEYVFGYAVGNDVTVRDWQQKTPQWMLGKSFDTHCPFGPSIVTADEVGDPHVLG